MPDGKDYLPWRELLDPAVSGAIPIGDEAGGIIGHNGCESRAALTE